MSDFDHFANMSNPGAADSTQKQDPPSPGSNRDSLNLDDFEKVEADQLPPATQSFQAVSGLMDDIVSQVTSSAPDMSAFGIGITSDKSAPVSDSPLFSSGQLPSVPSDPFKMETTVSDSFGKESAPSDSFASFSVSADPFSGKVESSADVLSSADAATTHADTGLSSAPPPPAVSSILDDFSPPSVTQTKPISPDFGGADSALVAEAEKFLLDDKSPQGLQSEPLSSFDPYSTQPPVVEPLVDPLAAQESFAPPTTVREPSPDFLTKVDSPKDAFAKMEPTTDLFGQKEPSPEPFMKEPSPDPFKKEPSPEPFMKEPSPDPFKKEPSPEPFKKEASPEPLKKEASPEPFKKEPSPDPFKKEASPEPFMKEPSPDPFMKEPSPEPFKKEPSPEPFKKEPSPDPYAFKKEPSPDPFAKRDPSPVPREPTPPPREPTPPPREPTPPPKVPTPTPPKEPTPPPRTPTPPREPTPPPREPTPPPKVPTPTPREPTPPPKVPTPTPREPTPPPQLVKMESPSAPLQEARVTTGRKYVYSASTKASFAVFNPLVDLIYWRDVKKTGVVFGGVMMILISLAYLSLITVVAYTSLAVLSGTITFRIYKNIMQAVQKSQDGHPFKDILELDTNLPSDKVHEATDVIIQQINSTISELKRLFLVEDLVDSVKFGCLLWCLTYLGSWFNGLTLVILAVVALFSLPKVYEQNQAQIDQYVGLVRSQVNDIMSKVKASLPIGNKEKTQ